MKLRVHPLGVSLLVFLFGNQALPAQKQALTPLIMTVRDAPTAFLGSDSHLHIVYELWLTNFSSGEVTLDELDVLASGRPIAHLDTKEIARRLQPAGLRNTARSLSKSEQALLFLHISLPPGTPVPERLTHRVLLNAAAAPPGHQHITETGGAIQLDHQPVAVIHAPLRGTGLIAADSCCDSTRHTRAALPVDDHVWLAQRYAVDWEQLNSDGRLYSGPRERVESYTIFGKPVLAVADATVVSVTDGQPEQEPGRYPSNISLDHADGNAIILQLSAGPYALYAHMQPHSIRVHPGQKVQVGDVLGLVGNSGNSIAPHLHFQVMSGPSSLSSNGLPYEIQDFEALGQSGGTDAFDSAEANGTPLEVHKFQPARSVHRGLPLDQQIVSFP